MTQQLHHKGITYEILKVEREFVFHPITLGLLPRHKASLIHDFDCSYVITNYKIYLTALSIDGVKQELANPVALSYDGAIFIANTMVEGYECVDEIFDVCAYKNAYELVFEDGVLITTVDQRKSMQRVRKNIEMGLRSFDKAKDIKCIKKFLASSLIGDYRPFSSDQKRFKYIEEMNNQENRKTIVSFFKKN